MLNSFEPRMVVIPFQPLAYANISASTICLVTIGSTGNSRDPFGGLNPPNGYILVHVVGVAGLPARWTPQGVNLHDELLADCVASPGSPICCYDNVLGGTLELTYEGVISTIATFWAFAVFIE